jgi:hypothetical protein
MLTYIHTYIHTYICRFLELEAQQTVEAERGDLCGFLFVQVHTYVCTYYV